MTTMFINYSICKAVSAFSSVWRNFENRGEGVQEHANAPSIVYSENFLGCDWKRGK
jgi:hypothetical protein